MHLELIKIKGFLFCIALSALAAISFPGCAHAEFVFTLCPIESDVVVTGLGTLNLTDLTLGPSGSNDNPNLLPAFAGLTSGSGGPYSSYDGVSGPPDFGTGLSTVPVLSSGDVAGIYGLNNSLQVPFGYISGTSLSSTSTFANATISSLGLTPGTYTYTWGMGLNADSIWVVIVPEPSTSALLAVCGGCFIVYWHRRSRRTA